MIMRLLISLNNYAAGLAKNKFESFLILGRHGSDSLCRDEREKKMAATYNVLAFKR